MPRDMTGRQMSMIEAAGLTKTYRVAQKKEGVLGALRGLYRREYREVRAVDGISFRIEPGEMVAFLGPNGAGKTTTLKMLSGLIYPTGGEARVLGYVPWQRADAFRRFQIGTLASGREEWLEFWKENHLLPPFGGPAVTALRLTLSARGQGTVLHVRDDRFGALGGASPIEGWQQVFDAGLRRYVEA